MNITCLRSLVRNGWNIANRRVLQKLIGKDECVKLCDEFKRISTECEQLYFANNRAVFCPTGDISLLNKNGDFVLKISAEIQDIYVKNHYLRFVNKDINLKNIISKVKEYQTKIVNYFDNAKELPESTLQSKTMKKLYTSEFKPVRRFNEDGYHVTTLIDNSTGTSVEAYVKCLYNKKACSHWKFSYPVDYENWGIFIKNSKGEYEMVGKRSFYIDKEKCRLLPDWMDSIDGFEQYSGIGLRCHQIGVERMMQENLSTVEICAQGQAFPFHYKSGFRVVQRAIEMPRERFNKILDNYVEESGLSKEVLEKVMVAKSVDDKIVFDSQTIENWHKLLYLKNNGKIMLDDTPMELRGEWLERWKQMAKAQPILLD